MKKSSQAYHAIIFAGGTGSRMIEVTTSIPKCLLPVGNKPMLWYPLNYLETNGFVEVTVIVPAKCLAHVQRLVSTVFAFSIKIDLVGLPADQESCGTAEALKSIADRIQSDFLLLSCDLITDFPLNELLAAHQSADATVTCLFSPSAVQGPSPGPKSKRKVEKDIIGIAPSEQQKLAFMASEDDLEEDCLKFSPSWVARFPRVNFTTKLTDCHLYVLKKWTLELLKKSDGFASIKADFVPYLISLQHREKFGPELQKLLKRNPFDQAALEYSHACADDTEDRVKCVAYVSKSDQASLCARVNNYGAYFEVNKQIVKAIPKWFSQTAGGGGGDCLVAQGATLRGHVKRSVIGQDCVLEQQTKVLNSLLMDCVHVGAGTTITNSIVCHSADIGEKAEVKDSIIGTNQEVIPLGRVVSEIVGDSSKMLDI